MSKDFDTTNSVEDINFNNESEDQDFQCNISGDIFEENEDLIQHVKDVHEDYYIVEENILLLKEEFLSKEMVVSKCKFCLDNFKINDLEQHTISFHFTEYAENIATNGFEDASLNDEEFLTDNSSERNTSSLNIDEINLVKEEQNETMNHSSKEIREQLKKDDHFCDVTLDCDDKRFQDHKIILNTFTDDIQSHESDIDETGMSKEDNAQKNSIFCKNFDYTKYDFKVEYDHVKEDDFDESPLKFSKKKFEDKLVSEQDCHIEDNVTIEAYFDNTATGILERDMNQCSIKQEMADAEMQHKVDNDSFDDLNGYIKKEPNKISNITHKIISAAAEINSVEENLNCKICENSFPNEISFIQHLTSFHEPTPKNLIKVDNLDSKNQQMTEGIKFPCEDCDKYFNSQLMLNKHIELNHLNSNHTKSKETYGHKQVQFSKMMRYILPHGQKSDVIDIMLGIARHLYIT